VTSANNIPQQLTSFVGREREIEEVARLLDSTRLLTLTGTGGAGKTRLALRVASDSLDNYPDGVWVVELGALLEGALVLQAVIATLELREEPGRDLMATLVEHLQPRRLLLLLDSCDHLIAACASLAYALLRACPELRILATSRQALGIDGEIAWRLPPLSMPDPVHLPPIEQLGQYEAVRLFIERANLKRPDFRMTGENAQHVAQLCLHLDGLPLAIELAAARMKVLSVEQILERLGERFRLLRVTNSMVLPRHQTLEALMDWSYDLLPEAEQALLRGLSVFAGSFTLDAVEAICGTGSDQYEVLDLVSQLVDKSLVQMEERKGEARYRLLETIRQYAWHKLEASGETASLRSRHLDWYLDIAEASETELLAEGQRLWLDRLEAEHDNLRAALAWGIHIGEAEQEEEGALENAQKALRIGGSLVWFWYFRGYLSEGRGWLARVLALRGSEARNRARAKALGAHGALAYLQSDFIAARALLEESLGIWRVLEDRRGSAFTLTFLGRVAVRQGDLEAAQFGEESVALFREIDDKWGIALSLDFLGEAAHMQGDDARAAALHEESLALYKELGDRWGMALEHSNFGRVAFRQGNLDAARARLEHALAIQREVGDRWTIAWTLHNLGDVIFAQGDCAGSRSLFEEGLALFKELGDKGGIASTLHRLGRCAQHEHDFERAEALLVEAMSLAQELGDERLARECQEALGQLRGKTQPAGDHASNYPSELTKREVEVLRLIAEGLTDAQVADRLFLSTRTVQAHLRSIYSKLNVTTRSAATRYAMEHGIV
jgi:predicted ATPase/DNA-binding CsgD family transcriptional regulator